MSSAPKLQSPKIVLFGLLASAILLVAVSLSGQDSAAKHPPQLYLVAGTTTEHGSDSYPVMLYTVDRYKRLDSVREVVRQEDGVRFIYAYGDAIFFLYPHDRPTSVAVLHTDDPGRVDNVTFSSTGVLGAYGELADPPRTGLELLLSWAAKPVEPGASIPKHLDVAQAAITGRVISGHNRIQRDRWPDYAYLRLQGSYGGPIAGPGELAFTKDGNLVLRDFDHPVAIDVIPPALKNLADGTQLFVFASTDHYLLFQISQSAAKPQSAKLGNDRTAYVHDRNRNQWNTIQTEGSDSLLRVFGSWIAETVGNSNANAPPSPGKENERTWDEKTERLPPVQRLYEQWAGPRPGVLILRNLEDGRKIRIETDQEDSEILWADEGSVLYRVNDQIYQARIMGAKLEDTTAIVQDEDVPEIHWAFWLK